ncbi:hypothetical protein AOQ84DRAFT_359904 [Glonium stellatum]|uniref:Carrier domain-containing protein n=1 Tax=Glonium stellatum TaxID=574774 RepID=A0A8E2F9U6_9PEZI|nr:hypothetical protein AOQ84DRAFT_359904 [Glonium stellatum]
MDENEILYVIGRYKDLIIRGGKNLAPAKIEQYTKRVSGVNVVGIPGPIAGEVPVAVVMQTNGIPKTDIMQSVVQGLGPEYALEAIMTLEELGLRQFPVTAIGRVCKNILKDGVMKHFKPVHTESETNITSTTNQLRAIWADLLNMPIAKIPVTASVFEFADSITLLRFCQRLWKKLGKKLYLEEFKLHPAVEQQAKLLDTRGLHNSGSSNAINRYQPEGNQNNSFEYNGLYENSSRSSRIEPRTGPRPPQLYDVAVANGDPHRFEQTIKETVKVLERYGLSWELDVEDVIPIKDYFLA